MPYFSLAFFQYFPPCGQEFQNTQILNELFFDKKLAIFLYFPHFTLSLQKYYKYK